MARRFGILIVGKDPEIVGPLAEAIGLLIPEGSVIQVAHTIKDAKERLLRERYHALLADQKLPDGLGASLLRTMLALRGQGLAYFLFGQLDADDSETIRLLQDHPEVSFIERPFRPDLAAHQICAAILPSTTADQSFYGLRLVDLIQAFSLGKRNTSLLVLMPDNKMGTIFIREGQLVHATVGREEGVDALARMIGCQKGEIRVQNGCTTSKETIRRPTQHTLIEVFRRLDERKRDTLRETQEDGEKAGGVRSSMRAGEQGPPFLAPAAPSPPSPPSLSSAPSHLVSPPPIPAPPAPPSPAGMRQSETQPGELIVEDADLAIRKKVVATNDVEFMREFDSMFDSTASGPPLDALLASAAAAATLGDPGAVPAQIQNKLPSPSLPSLPPLPPLSSAPPMAPAAAREKDTETFAGARQAPAALASAPPSPARLVSSLGPELAPAAPSKPSSRILSYPAVFSASPGAEPHPPRDQVATAPSNPGDSDMGLPAPSRPMTASFRIRASASPPQEQPGLPPSPVPQSAATTLRPFLRPAIPPRPRSASDTDWSKQIPKKSVRDLLDEALKS